MVEDKELQELYGLIYTAIDGFNKTHDVQVCYCDFKADMPIEDDADQIAYDGTVVFPRYEVNVIDYHYRDLRKDDFDWFEAGDWAQACVDREAIAEANRREAQKRHREGTLRYAPWLHNPRPYPVW